MARKTGSEGGGRKRGSHNRGFWFRSGRGWYVTEGRSSVPLCDLQGNHIKLKGNRKEAETAYGRYLDAKEKSEKQRIAGDHTPLETCCNIYLDHVNKHGAASTYEMRSRLLFDFCTGFPPKFQGGKHKPTKEDRIHPGYRDKPVGELIGLDVEKWLDAHPDWDGTRRAAIQALKRALSFCVQKGVISTNPMRGYSAGIERRVHPHSLRHSHASELRSEGVDLGIISRQLGHSSMATTSRFFVLDPRPYRAHPGHLLLRVGLQRQPTRTQTHSSR